MGQEIGTWLQYMQEALWAKDHLGDPSEWAVLKMEDFAENPGELLRKICALTTIACSSEIVEKVVERTHRSPHHSRASVAWKSERIERINQFIRIHLADYYDPVIFL
jgi:hypothetical protein